MKIGKGYSQSSLTYVILTHDIFVVTFCQCRSDVSGGIIDVKRFQRKMVPLQGGYQQQQQQQQQQQANSAAAAATATLQKYER